jgi:hypothetical protein
MKIVELLNEDEESIKTYWQLRNDINIADYYSAYDKILGDSNSFRSRQDMLTLSCYVQSLLHNEDWQYLEGDPDFDKVYDSLLDLYENIQARLARR